MIPVKDRSTIIDNMGGQKTQMTVRAEDWSKISGLLINLYSDVIMACVREYSTNAFDSHIDAGQTRAIEVTLPNAFSNLFVVRDFGTGMSLETLEKVYCMFGASTKDQSNDFNGSMGLGSKSALTYANAFTIISVKDGKSNTAIVSRDEEGNGIMETLPEQDTTEPNGTTVQIPCASGDEFKFSNRANDLYRHWPEGTVILNGKPFEPSTPLDLGYEELSPGRYANTGSSYNVLNILMGNVVYPHRYPMSSKFTGAVGLFAEIPNGDVMFAPSRESLLMNRATTKYIENLIDEMTDQVVKKVNDALNSSKTIQEALEAYRQYKGILVDGVAEWNGIKLGTGVRWLGRYYNTRQDNTSKVTNISVTSGYSESTVFLTNFGMGNLSRGQKDAIRAYNKSLPEDKQFTIMYYQNEIPPLFSEARTIDWLKIKPMVSKAVGSGASAAKATFDTYEYIDGALLHSTRQIPDGKKILFESTKYMRAGWDNHLIDMDWLSEFPNTILVVIPVNRWKKFRVDYPSSLHLSAFITTWLQKQVAKVTDEEKDALRQSSRKIIVELNGKTNDKYIDKLSSSLVSFNTKAKGVDKVLSAMHRGTLASQVSFGNAKHYILENYPLIDKYSFERYNKTYIEHSIAYINAVHAQKQP